jgi:hypothetical protein
VPIVMIAAGSAMIARTMITAGPAHHSHSCAAVAAHRHAVIFVMTHIAAHRGR